MIILPTCLTLVIVSNNEVEINFLICLTDVIVSSKVVEIVFPTCLITVTVSSNVIVGISLLNALIVNFVMVSSKVVVIVFLTCLMVVMVSSKEIDLIMFIWLTRVTVSSRVIFAICCVVALVGVGGTSI